MGRPARLAIEVVGTSRDAEAALNRTSTAAGRMSGAARRAGVVGAAGLAAVAAGGWKAVQAAGRLEQSSGALDTVFGRNAAQMQRWSKQAQTSVGLTRNEYAELGTLIGTQLKNGGTAMDDLGPKTNKLITQAADLSAMYGGSTKEAVDALSSALKGERDPIERYGVSLRQSAIDAKAAEMGYKKVGGSLSNQATQAATLALITEQSRDAQGRFAAEQNTLTGQSQRASATLGNFAARIGTMLLPTFTEAATLVNTKVLPSIDKLITKAETWFNANGQPSLISRLGLSGAGDVSGIVTSIGSSLQKMRPAMQESSGSIRSLGSSGLKLLPQLLKAAATGAAFLARHADKLPVILGTLAGAVALYKTSQIASNYAAAAAIPIRLGEIGANLALASSNRALAAARATDTAATTSNTTANNVGLLSRMRNTAANLASAAASKAVAAGQAIMTAGQWALNAAMSANPIALVVIAVIALVAILVIAWKRSDTFRRIVTGAWTAIKKAASGVVGWLRRAVPAAWDWIKKMILKYSLPGLVASHWDQIKAAFRKGTDYVKVLPGRAWGFMKRMILKYSLPGLIIGHWDQIKTGVRTKTAQLVEFVKGIPKKILDQFKNIGRLLREAGVKLILGLVGGIRSKLGKVGDTAREVAAKIGSFFPGSPVKEGPLRAWNGGGSGRQLTTWLAQGLRSGGPRVGRAALSVARDHLLAAFRDANRYRNVSIFEDYSGRANPGASSAARRAVARLNAAQDRYERARQARARSHARQVVREQQTGTYGALIRAYKDARRYRGVTIFEDYSARANAGASAAARRAVVRLNAAQDRHERRRLSSGGGRTVNVTVNGAVDPVSTARQIKRLLAADTARTGYAL